MTSEVFYGLPREVRFCRRCVISNQRPNSAIEFGHIAASKKQTIQFDADGICDACRVAEAKASIDWKERERELRALCDEHRRTDGYDCIVPGSGGKDSFYAAWRLKYDFGMHPLTVTWAPHIYTDWGWRNFQRWINAGFDNELHTPSPRTHRLLTRLALENLLHPFQPFIIGQKALAPKIAALHGVNLIFYGENEAEYGSPREDCEKATRDAAYFTGHPDDIYMSGLPVSELAQYGIEPRDLKPYFPVEHSAAEVHYLGYYLKWHPQSCYYHAVEHGGFEAAPERNPGTYSKYNSIDDKMDDLHYYTTYVKFGIGRATYDAAQEVRSGDITREEAAKLVLRFDGEFPMRFIKELLQYLSVPGFEPVTREYFSALCDRFRSPHLWGHKQLTIAAWHSSAVRA